MSIELAHRSDSPGVVAWRRDQLVRSGFSELLAARVARDQRFDIHALIELTERGCAPELAVRILTPFDEPQAA
jgi:hypothetical protein